MTTEQGKNTGSSIDGTPSVVGFILAAAVALVSTLVYALPSQPVVALEAARAAIARTGGSGQRVVLVNPRHEEIVFSAGGSIEPLAPWREVEDKRWVALAHDPAALPSRGSAVAVEPPWAARRVGTGAGTEDLLAMLERAEVSIVDAKSGEVRQCTTYQTGRWFCGPNPWNFVGPNELVIDGQRRRCLWLHPHEEGELRVRLSGMRGASRFVGRYALSDEAAATSGGAPVRFEARSGGQTIFTVVHPNQRGWVDMEMDLPGDADDLELSVKSSSTGRRHFCILGGALDGGSR